ncbi:G2/mitotic-specific cyclin-B3-like [Dendronephthya gigantea]|uniref:G2/mitotic-specific cyclin-B3-like n=1 Tax=Dendronephthya gigantea TaxID=151771 RepID=UPI00106A7EF8|nr:G2/mitotic-specific cyclin-B3-like [Dendronephthya gigantea]
MKSQRISLTSNQKNAKESIACKGNTTNSRIMASDRRKSNENAKRQAEESPNNAPTRKRSALGDMTNASKLETNVRKSKSKCTVKSNAEKNAIRQPSTYQTRRRSKEAGFVAKKNAENQEKSVRASQLEKTSKTSEPAFTEEDVKDIVFTEEPQTEIISIPSVKTLELDVVLQAKHEVEKPVYNDIDEDTSDEFAMAEYANEIFKNMKKQEEVYVLTAYMSTQPKINANMRAILVDWLVEVQENFELYHETLYLAVKIVDHYLEKNNIEREELQLLGATAVFLACKIEERHPPYLDDFLFICDDAYKKSDLLKMEIKVFASLGYCLAIPIPYRFLRRFAKAADANMETLTLARYILETSLLEYDFVPVRASKMAAACLCLAMAMKDMNEWTSTLIYYTGYTRDDLSELVAKLNLLISVQPKRNLKTVHSKYSHPVFFQVADTPVLDVLAM